MGATILLYFYFLKITRCLQLMENIGSILGLNLYLSLEIPLSFSHINLQRLEITKPHNN